jgi:hypothetical protein
MMYYSFFGIPITTEGQWQTEGMLELLRAIALGELCQVLA